MTVAEKAIVGVDYEPPLVVSQAIMSIIFGLRPHIPDQGALRLIPYHPENDARSQAKVPGWLNSRQKEEETVVDFPCEESAYEGAKLREDHLREVSSFRE